MKTKQNNSPEITVCILAYNEETHIENTIKNLIEGNEEITFTLKVYANGCTDDTVKIVKNLESTYSNLSLRELKIAGKPNAWNTAFTENKTEILIFSDADIMVESGSIKALSDEMMKNDDIISTTTQYTAFSKKLSFGKKLAGFMQLPIEQDFIAGCFYTIRRAKFEKIFSKNNITGIPDGLVGEDLFIDLLVPREKLIVIDKKCFYEPTNLEEYAKFFARMRWQNQQMQQIFERLDIEHAHPISNKKITTKLKERWDRSKNKTRLLYRLIPAVFRYTFLFFNKNKINAYYQDLGPVIEQGNHILIETRSSSTK
ncbi:MAG: glycosyltransferase family 2 protein [Sulfurovum sp.]|nr:glycosyltransferase family 2 protein [Sulfurovum sp.]